MVLFALVLVQVLFVVGKHVHRKLGGIRLVERRDERDSVVLNEIKKAK